MAEERSVTRGAARLGLGRTSVSAALARLERELGVALLRRTARGVEPTDAGRTLLAEGRPLLAAAEAAWERTRLAGAGHAGTLRIGSTQFLATDELPVLVDAMRAHEPALDIELREDGPGALGKGLLSGELDVALMPFTRDDAGGLRLETLARRPLCAAVPAGHALAGRAEVDLPELAELPLLLWYPPERSRFASFLVELFRARGVEPRTLLSPMASGAGALAEVAEGHAAALVVASWVSPAEAVTVRVVPLVRPAPTLPLRAVWDPMRAPPAVERFVEVSRTVAADRWSAPP